MDVGIIDYNMGNLGSIQNMLRRIGFESEITRDPSRLSKASKLILPGVGAFDRAMRNLHDYELIDFLNEKKKANIPILGICLGMQLLLNGSEEGELSGLGWIPGRAKKFESSTLRIPHMGWNYAHPSVDVPILKELSPKYYFVHSFYASLENSENELMNTDYGLNFSSAIFKENVFGFQFHPEKSHKFGMRLLENFCKL